MRLLSITAPLALLLAAPLITLSDAQVTALDAVATKACRKFVGEQYPDAVQTKAIGRVQTFGSDRDHDQHYGVEVQVAGGDRWMCLYDRDKSAVGFAGIITKTP